MRIFPLIALLLSVMPISAGAIGLQPNTYVEISVPSNGWDMTVSEDTKTIAVTRQSRSGIRNVTPSGLAWLASFKNHDFQNFAFDALDSSHAWILLDDYPHTYVFRTTDSGRRWTHCELHAVTGFGIDSISFSDPIHGGLLICADPWSGHMAKAVYRTSDGGRRWRLASYSGDVHSKRTPGALPEMGFPTGLTVRTASDFWVARDYRDETFIPLYHSANAGRVWAVEQLPRPPIPVALGFRYIDCYPPSFSGRAHRQGCFQISETGDHGSATVTYRTQDGGKTWHPGQSDFRKVDK